MSGGSEIAGVVFRTDADGVDWEQFIQDLAADAFDNGRTPEELARSFEKSFSVIFAWRGAGLIGSARLLSDGVCNAYLVDVWTHSGHRRQGIAGEMVRRLLETVPGQHVILQTDHEDHFYSELGFTTVSGAMEIVVGTWLNRHS